MATTNNYTLGRGKIMFSRFKTGTQTPAGFRYIGNTPEFNLTIESENLDHFSSDYGIREKDDSVVLEVTRSGSMITDNIKPENVALFFFGDATTVTQVESLDQEEEIDDVIPGHAYKLGQSEANPSGYFGLSRVGFNVATQGASLVAATGTLAFSGTGTDGDNFTIGDQVYFLRTEPTLPYEIDIGASAAATAGNVVAAINGGAGEGTAYGTGTLPHPDVSAALDTADVDLTALVEGTAGNSIVTTENGSGASFAAATLTGGTGTSYIEGTDYTVDYDNGLLTIVDGGGIAEGTDLDVFFGVAASTRDRVISGSDAVEGALMFIAANPKGKDFNYYMPWIKVTPNGDYALKGDEWQQIPFNLEILKPTNSPAITMDGKPAYA